ELERCIALYAQVVQAGVAAGADLIVIETMSDTLELKAAVLAAKENSTLPVFASVVLDANGKLLTGGDLPTVVALLEGLGVDVIGLNCGIGPRQMLSLAVELLEHTSLPVMISPNAGLPQCVDGCTGYDIDAEQFAAAMGEVALAGAWAVGGCCGTTPEHMKQMIAQCDGIVPKAIVKKTATVVSSYARAVRLGDCPVIIGERINPTGKKRFKQALVEHDIDFILGEGIKQQQCGAQVLDVNVGLPEIDETAMMTTVVTELQGVTDLPLQLDTASPAAMAAAMRVYNGKPMINSVNGKAESMAAIFPLVKKYGGVVVGLTLDEQGIPPTAQGRLAVAKKIIDTAATYGIDKKDIVIDVLTMTVSAQADGALTTLRALELVREQLGVCTVLGVSNISFGLPRRDLLNAAFFAMALQNGLSAAIVNPGVEGMMASYRAYCVLAGYDENCLRYIATYADQPTGAVGNKPPDTGALGLELSVERGLRESSVNAVRQLLAAGELPLEIIDRRLIPALDRVGKGFEQHTVFLPQLLMSAEAAKAAFGEIREVMQQRGERREKGEKVVLATVKGDIHDIGKNIVKVLLENYGFDVIDLGKDVDPQRVVDAVLAHKVRLVGLSALMTTTVAAMGETIRLLKIAAPDCRVAVGGAVLNQEYADSIGADFYGADAMATVQFAQSVSADNRR
ncbi:MAG: dihydropteroate synthase, partial [Angelakisella sp.]